MSEGRPSDIETGPGVQAHLMQEADSAGQAAPDSQENPTDNYSIGSDTDSDVPMGQIAREFLEAAQEAYFGDDFVPYGMDDDEFGDDDGEWEEYDDGNDEIDDDDYPIDEDDEFDPMNPENFNSPNGHIDAIEHITDLVQSDIALINMLAMQMNPEGATSNFSIYPWFGTDDDSDEGAHLMEPGVTHPEQPRVSDYHMLGEWGAFPPEGYVRTHSLPTVAETIRDILFISRPVRPHTHHNTLNAKWTPPMYPFGEPPDEDDYFEEEDYCKMANWDPSPAHSASEVAINGIGIGAVPFQINVVYRGTRERIPIIQGALRMCEPREDGDDDEEAKEAENNWHSECMHGPISVLQHHHHNHHHHHHHHEGGGVIDVVSDPSPPSRYSFNGMVALVRRETGLRIVPDSVIIGSLVFGHNVQRSKVCGPEAWEGMLTALEVSIRARMQDIAVWDCGGQTSVVVDVVMEN